MYVFLVLCACVFWPLFTLLPKLDVHSQSNILWKDVATSANTVPFFSVSGVSMLYPGCIHLKNQ